LSSWRLSFGGLCASDIFSIEKFQGIGQRFLALKSRLCASRNFISAEAVSHQGRIDAQARGNPRSPRPSIFKSLCNIQWSGHREGSQPEMTSLSLERCAGRKMFVIPRRPDAPIAPLSTTLCEDICVVMETERPALSHFFLWEGIAGGDGRTIFHSRLEVA